MREVDKINDYLVYYLARMAGFTCNEASGIATGYKREDRNFLWIDSFIRYHKIRNEGEDYDKEINTSFRLAPIIVALGASLHAITGDDYARAQAIYETLCSFLKSDVDMNKIKRVLEKYLSLSFIDGLAFLTGM